MLDSGFPLALRSGYFFGCFRNYNWAWDAAAFLVIEGDVPIRKIAQEGAHQPKFRRWKMKTENPFLNAGEDAYNRFPGRKKSTWLSLSWQEGVGVAAEGVINKLANVRTLHIEGCQPVAR